MYLSKKRANKEYAQKLKEQSDAAHAAADQLTNFAAQAKVRDGANTLGELARKRENENLPGQIMELPPTASTIDLKESRRRRAVRFGDDVYLPSWQDAAVLFPNMLLRSSLFSGSNPGEILNQTILGSPGNFRIEMTGPRLGYYDRRVFGVCLQHYQAERPLASSNDSPWVSSSFWQLAEKMGAYNKNAPVAIRNSLKRLEAVRLRIYVGRYELPVPRLIDVAFEHGLTDIATPDKELKSSAKAVFRISDTMAALFGEDEWTALSNRTLHDHEGLAAWVCNFYATHGRPFELKLQDIYDYAGATDPMAEFKKRLRRALEKLQLADTAEEHRISSFDMTKHTLKVHLCRWSN